MSKLRVLFRKEQQASYISHLDLMRTFQRVFPRSGLHLKHSQGFHPHPIISIVLPLPVGQSSDCELMDCEVLEETGGHEYVDRLNEAMPCGLKVLDCYDDMLPVKKLSELVCSFKMDYDNGVPENAAEALQELFSRDSIIIQKKTKHHDLADVDIAPMIHAIRFEEGENRICGQITVQAQNPGLNPQLMEKTIQAYLPQMSPDFVQIRRLKLLDDMGNSFK